MLIIEGPNPSIQSLHSCPSLFSGAQKTSFRSDTLCSRAMYVCFTMLLYSEYKDMNEWNGIRRTAVVAMSCSNAGGGRIPADFDHRWLARTGRTPCFSWDVAEHKPWGTFVNICDCLGIAVLWHCGLSNLEWRKGMVHELSRLTWFKKIDQELIYRFWHKIRESKENNPCWVLETLAMQFKPDWMM